MNIVRACASFVYNGFSGIANEEQALRETINADKQSWERAMHMLPIKAKKCCDLAIKFHKAGNVEKANEWIHMAKECTDANTVRTWEYLRNLQFISEAQIEMNFDASETITLAIEEIPSLREAATEITMYTTFAAILMSLGRREEAIELVHKAQKSFEPYEKKEGYYSWLPRAREQMTAAQALIEN